MYLSHLVRSEGMKIWTFWPKWAESVSARRQSVEQEKVWKVSYEAATYPGGGYQHFFAIFRSRHFFRLHFSPSFFWKFYTPRCMNRISHLAPMSFLETVKWLWPECQIDHPANCGIWALSHFIFAILQYQEFFWYLFLLYDSSFFLFVIIISWCFFLFSTADKRRLSEFDLFYMRLLLGHETPLPALTTLTKSQTKKTSKVWK